MDDLVCVDSDLAFKDVGAIVWVGVSTVAHAHLVTLCGSEEWAVFNNRSVLLKDVYL